MISVLQDTLSGLEEAVAAVTELKMFNLASFEDHPAYRTLTKAQTRIKACHKSFGVRTPVATSKIGRFLIAGQLGDWSQWELFILDAIRKDKERMGRVNKLLETVGRFAALLHQRDSQWQSSDLPLQVKRVLNKSS